MRETLRIRGPIKRLYRRVTADACVFPDLTVATPCTCNATQTAAQPVPVDGRVCVRAGQWVHFVATDANRDAAAFPDPDQLDPHRDITGGCRYAA